MTQADLDLIHRMVVVTNRHIFINQYGEDEALWMPPFLAQIHFLASLHPAMIVLREKDMEESAYEALAAKVQALCEEAEVPFAVHLFDRVALRLGVRRLHLPLWKIKEGSSYGNLLLGTSVHEAAEGAEAEKLGASWLFAGNVYETTCKPGKEARGLAYLRSVCDAVSIPVYGIGGISLPRMAEVLTTGAAGGCMMSGFMTLGYASPKAAAANLRISKGFMQ